MVLQINEDYILKCNFVGKGGKEKQIISCFKNKLVKKSGKLFDCIDIETEEKYELKKQKNQQWLDPRKFFNLSKKDEKITLVFFLIDQDGYCDIVATVKLGDFISRNYSANQLLDAHRYAEKYPKDQIKSGINIREFINKNSDIIEFIWQKN